MSELANGLFFPVAQQVIKSNLAPIPPMQL